VYTEGTAAVVAQVSPLATTFKLFVDNNPVPVTCTTHGNVIGHITDCVSGPCNVNKPTLNE
jgi:hypothetical protein